MQIAAWCKTGLVVAQRGDVVKTGQFRVDWASSQLATIAAVLGYALVEASKAELAACNTLARKQARTGKRKRD